MVEKKLNEPTPKGLEIKCEEGKENITITLGDDVDLGKIIQWLVEKQRIQQFKYKQDKPSSYKLRNDKDTITIKMQGNRQDDVYGVQMMADEKRNNLLFGYDEKRKKLFFNNDLQGNFRYVCRNKNIQCLTTEQSSNLLALTGYYLEKDVEGNLSWYKTTKDGKVYMCNATGQNGDPECIDDEKWKPIRHTFWSNIYQWYWNNFDDFDDEIKKQTSEKKRFGRLFIGQQNITGDWLCGSGCCSFTPSGYNEYDFYKEKPNDNKKSNNNIIDDSQEIVNSNQK